MTKNQTEVVTFGCRLNSYESEVMRNHAAAKDLKNTIIFNTCAVTNEAERQARQAIRRARRDNPDAKIIVTGCSAQINPDRYLKMEEVDQVLGNMEKMQVESYGAKDSLVLSDIMQVKEAASHMISGFESQVRAFIEIQNGCDHRCTFCRIPYGRGNNRSIPIAAVVRQVQELINNGCREVVFTGVDITGYGSDLPGTPSLGSLCKRVLSNVPELRRLRLSSIDPAELDDEVHDLIALDERLLPHFHISLQAGDDLILRRMKRRHLRQDIIDFCNRVRRLRPDAVFGADIIAGFPTETEEMHNKSVELIESCNIPLLHVFPYSAVADTPAARMPQVASADIKRRAAALRKLGESLKIKLYESMNGKTVSVLVEKVNFGHSNQFLPVAFKDLDASFIGTIQTISITGCDQKGLKGHLLQEK